MGRVRGWADLRWENSTSSSQREPRALKLHPIGLQKGNCRSAELVPYSAAVKPWSIEVGTWSAETGSWSAAPESRSTAAVLPSAAAVTGSAGVAPWSAVVQPCSAALAPWSAGAETGSAAAGTVRPLIPARRPWETVPLPAGRYHTPGRRRPTDNLPTEGTKRSALPSCRSRTRTQARNPPHSATRRFVSPR